MYSSIFNRTLFLLNVSVPPWLTSFLPHCVLQTEFPLCSWLTMPAASSPIVWERHGWLYCWYWWFVPRFLLSQFWCRGHSWECPPVYMVSFSRGCLREWTCRALGKGCRAWLESGCFLQQRWMSILIDSHTEVLSDFGVLIMWVWNSASDFILGWFNRHFWFLMSSVTSPWVVRSSVFAQWSALDPVCYQVAFSFTNWFFVDLLLLLLCPFMCYRNFGWEDACNFNITEFIFWYVLLVLISTCIVS